MSGTLYLCATPIGNLKDITLRVIETLESVDLIAAEDTRISIKLLNHFKINTPMTSYHEHNKYEKGEQLIERLLNGEDIALITDAGTPGISDPGEELVIMCYEAGIRVTALPGAAACIAALSISGQSTRRFVFEGFLPSGNKARTEAIKSLCHEPRTIVIYEAPHRLVKTLESLLSHLDNRQISVCRELTKRYETVYKGDLESAIAFYEKQPPKGECVLVISGKDLEELKQEAEDSWNEWTIEEHMDFYLSEGIDKKEAMKKVAKDRGVSKRDVYNYLVTGTQEGG